MIFYDMINLPDSNSDHPGFYIASKINACHSPLVPELY